MASRYRWTSDQSATALNRSEERRQGQDRLSRPSPAGPRRDVILQEKHVTPSSDELTQYTYFMFVYRDIFMHNRYFLKCENLLDLN